MNKLKEKNDAGLFARFKLLPQPTRRLFLFQIISIILTPLSLWLAQKEINDACLPVTALINFVGMYSFLLLAIVTMSCRYNHDKNVAAGLSAGLMAIIGGLMAAYVHGKLANNDLGLINLSYIGAIILLSAGIPALLCRALYLKTFKLYALSLGQLLIVYFIWCFMM